MEARQAILQFPETEEENFTISSDVFIDEGFPEKEANDISKLESYNKHLFRPNTYLHKWWARRSGTTFRYILKQLVPNPKRRDFYASGGLDGISVLDPMMGGGTTLHEAIRLGANVFGYDIDPIPVLQAKASLEDLDAAEKQQVFNNFFKELNSILIRYYKTKCPICKKEALIQFTLYGLRKSLGSKEFIVIDSYNIRTETDGSNISIDQFYADYEVCFNNKKWQIIDKAEAKRKGINGKQSDILSIPFCKRYIPLIIMGECAEHCNFFKKVDNYDVDNFANILENQLIFKPREIFQVKEGPKSNDLLARSVSYYYDIFHPRQLLYIYNCKKLIEKAPDEHRIWLALLISTSLEFNSALCGYKGVEARRPGAIRHVFSHHAYSFPYTSLENNPIFPKPKSGNLLKIFRSRILDASTWAKNPVERSKKNGKWVKKSIFGESDSGVFTEISEFKVDKRKQFFVKQIDSSKLPNNDKSIDYVVTDPPYFDNVQYSDLSNFFRCWLQWFIPNEADWNFKISASAVAEKPYSGDKFGAVLGKIWKETNRVLKRPHGRLVFTYHHWRPNAWAQLSIALSEASFQLANAYIVHSENPISVHIMNLKSLQHDAILVLCPKDIHIKRTWPKPSPIDNTDSYHFCKSCSSILGWVLQSDFDKKTINRIWDEYLKGF
jgi:putative DNA methylase